MTTESEPIAITPELFCPECGYSLRGIQSQRCPECGHELEWSGLAESRIPWVHRAEIGRWRAYWRTVWRTCTDSRVIASDMVRPVSFEDARRFRNVTIWLAFGPLALVALVSYGLMIEDWPGWDKWFRPTNVLNWFLETGIVPAGLLGLFAFFKTATAAPAWFFHPRDLPVVRQNRAVALSYYGSAPLAFMPVTVPAVAAWAAWAREGWLQSGPVVLVALVSAVALGIVVVQLMTWWLGLVQLLQRTTQCSGARMWTMSILLPLIWAALFAVIAAGIPAAYAFVAIVVLSLR
jgi:hypothetical protein